MKRILMTTMLVAATILTGCAMQRPTHEIREAGDWHFKRGDYARAAQEYQEIAARHPGDWEAQYKLGLSLLETGDLRDARRALEIAHDRKPDNPDVVDALAEAMYRQGDEAQLFAFLRDRAQSTQTVRAYLRLGKYAAEMNDPDSAQVAVRTAIELDNGRTVEPYLVASEFAQARGQVDEAVRRLRQAYGINPDDERVLTRLRELGEIPGPTLALPPGR